MALLVQKYGGTSVGSVDRIQNVARRVARSHQAGDHVVVVVSAMSGETNRLLGLAHEMSAKPSARELDVIVSTGEQVTIGLLCIALQDLGVDSVSYTGTQVALRTDTVHGKARIESIDDENIRTDLTAGKVVVVAGFQGVAPNGSITTLGRGGSDTSAVAIAAALDADECVIYTDVDGVYTTDPRVEPKARRLQQITFEEMLELASLGSKVLQIRSVEFAGKYDVKLRVASSFEDGPGTLITIDNDESLPMEKALISGIAFNRDEAQLTVSQVQDIPGVAAKILGPVSDANIEIDMIVQNIAADGTTDFTFTVNRGDYNRSLELLEQTAKELGSGVVTGNDEIVKVSIVGVGMRSHAGIAGTMFKALGDEGINIALISTSEIKISVAIDEKYMELAVRALHRAFELDKEVGSA